MFNKYTELRVHKNIYLCCSRCQNSEALDIILTGSFSESQHVNKVSPREKKQQQSFQLLMFPRQSSLMIHR